MMKRFRLSTMMLLIVIVALIVALMVQHDRASRRITELEATARPTWELISGKVSAESEVRRLKKRVKELEGTMGKEH